MSDIDEEELNDMFDEGPRASNFVKQTQGLGKKDDKNSKFLSNLQKLHGTMQSIQDIKNNNPNTLDVNQPPQNMTNTGIMGQVFGNNSMVLFLL